MTAALEQHLGGNLRSLTLDKSVSGQSGNGTMEALARVSCNPVRCHARHRRRRQTPQECRSSPLKFWSAVTVVCVVCCVRG